MGILRYGSRTRPAKRSYAHLIISSPVWLDNELIPQTMLSYLKWEPLSRQLLSYVVKHADYTTFLPFRMDKRAVNVLHAPKGNVQTPLMAPWRAAAFHVQVNRTQFDANRVSPELWFHVINYSRHSFTPFSMNESFSIYKWRVVQLS